ncbi:MAG: glycosyltransferase family 4 protein [Anaerolineaceae bacterium]|nr:glycosyltransferase family 4 protein [Anaerolineaceae bacterium]
MRNIRAMLEQCEGVLASTNFLAERIAALGKPVWIHRNAFSLEMLACSEAARVKKADNPGKVVIGYASGTPTHNRDFELVKPALQSIMRRDPRVVLRLVGPLDPGAGWEDLENRIERMKLVPWRKLPGILAGFDINLAPLVMDNPFAQSKSEIKYMEAAMGETPTIASATDAFRYAIRDAETGLLVETPEGWESAVERLAQDASLRVEMGHRAYQTVIEEYHPVTRATQLVQILDEMSLKLRGQPFWPEDKPDAIAIAERAHSMSQGKRWLPRRYEKDPSNFELGLYSLRHRGLKTLARQVWIYFRRLVAPIFPFKQG